MDLTEPLDNFEIEELLPLETKILRYKELKDLDSCFDEWGRCVILYPGESEDSGHWVGMIRRPGEIEYFDPYGDGVDVPLSHVPAERKRSVGAGIPKLREMLERERSNGVKVTSNPIQFQSLDPQVATCGKHVTARLRLAALPLKKYAQVFELARKNGLTPDEVVEIFSKAPPTPGGAEERKLLPAGRRVG